MTKRIFDIMFSFAMLCLLWPLLIIIALAIKVVSPGAVFYKGQRAGRSGVPFHILKFRTMVSNAEALGGVSTPEDDPRVTSVGRILRKYKLDELPQLFNVLKGEMSVVGPRPEVISEVKLYTRVERELLMVRPGMTDWASVRFRNEGEILKGSPEPHQTYREKIRPEKMRLGLQYARTHSFLIDMQVLAATAKALLWARGGGR
ncbi:MAG: sugar transferase [Candidatus Acidiferrales bacterium]